jgi:hypothetical protein
MVDYIVPRYNIFVVADVQNGKPPPAPPSVTIPNSWRFFFSRLYNGASAANSITRGQGIGYDTEQ